jgi:hypothetical protein
MSELFNQRSSVEGKIPSGLFNACFDLDSGVWAQDAAATKCLAMDGYFISLFDLRLDRRPLALADHVLRDVPAAWDPAAIARFVRAKFRAQRHSNFYELGFVFFLVLRKCSIKKNFYCQCLQFLPKLHEKRGWKSLIHQSQSQQVDANGSGCVELVAVSSGND